VPARRLLPLLLLAAGCAHSLVRADIHQRGWFLVETEHISLRTDLPRMPAYLRALSLEDEWDALARNYDLLAPGATRPTGRFAVIHFARCADFDQIRPRAGGGFVIAIDSEGVAITCAQRRSDGLVHELAHIFNHHYFGLPRWLDEGLATYYETIELWLHKLVVGKVPGVATFVLRRRDPLLDLGDLRALRAETFYDSDREFANYTSAWKLVHLLSNTTPERLRAFRRYLAALRGGVPESTAWQQAGLDEPALNLAGAYRSYAERGHVRQLTSPFVWHNLPAKRMRSLRPGEAHILWATLVRLTRPDLVASQLEFAEKADPDWPGLLYWRAQLLRPRDEVDLLRAYVARRPDDEKGRWALVRARIRRATVEQDGLPVASQDELSLARGDVRALIEHSSQPLALNTVAWYYAVRREPNIGLNFAMRAVQAEPACADCWDTLALLYFEAGKVDLAIQAQERAVGTYAERVPGEVRSRLQLYRDARR
jgi:hypothetical protein